MAVAVAVGVAMAAAGSLVVTASVTASVAVPGPMAASRAMTVPSAGAMAPGRLGGRIRGRMLCRGHRPIIARRRKAYCSARVIRR